MSNLYYNALDKYSEIMIYLEGLNKKVDYLFAQSIVMGPKCNDKSNIQKLNEINRELAKIREEIPVVIFLLGQIKSINDQFFREYHFKDIPKTAESNYIAFINSSTYKAAFGEPSLRL